MTLQVPTQKKIQTLIFLISYIHWIKYFERSKLFHQYKRQKLVHAEFPLVLLFSIRKVKDLKSFCSKKLIETLIFLNSYIDWIKYSVRSKLFHQHERQKSVHAGSPLVLLFLI